MSDAKAYIKKRDSSSPKMRFKGFNEIFSSAHLEQLSSIRTGPFGSVLHQEDYVEEGTPIITVEHLSELGIVHENLPLVSDMDKQRLQSYILKKGDIVFSRVGSVDRNSIVSDKEKGWLFSGRLLRIRTEKNRILPEYLSYYFQQEHTKYRIRSVAVGQTMASLNTEILNSFIVQFTPDINEQQKIASFLTAVDEKIQQLTRKKELLEQYKKGVMQQLFPPAGGQASGKLRFKDENRKAYPKWEEKRLSEVSQIRSGISKEQSDKGKYKVTRIETISAGVINEDKVGLIDSVNGFEEYKLKKGDILFSNINSVSHIGKTAIAKTDLDIYHGMNLLCFKASKGIYPQFLFYFLNTEKTRNYFKAICNQAVSQASINQTSLGKTKLFIPVIEEQQKIASYLTALDAKIESVATQIAHTQTFKKGLLQQMFV